MEKIEVQKGNFRDEQGNVIEPKNMVNYNHRMGYLNKGDRMANSHSTSPLDME